MAARTFPTYGLAPIDGYVVDEGGRNVAHFTRSVIGTLSIYGPTVQAEVDITATGTCATHATAVRAVVSEADGATMTNAVIAPLSVETYITDAPNLHAMMRFNTNSALDVPDCWFFATGDAVAYAQDRNTTTVAGTIRVKINGENLLNTFGRIRVYQDE